MIKNLLKAEIEAAAAKVYPDLDILPHFEVESSLSRPGGADYATNIALVLAPLTKIAPQEVAKTLQNALLDRRTFRDAVGSVEIAGPGFLNLSLKPERITEAIVELGKNVQDGFSFLSGTKTNIEFISANPTGKLHIGHGRGAFFGDVLANVLEFSGGFVTREYYINNSRESKQIIELGKTALGVGKEYKTPALEKQIEKLNFDGTSEAEAGFLLAGEIQKENARFVENELGVKFDTYYSEDEYLRAKGRIEKMRVQLEKEKRTYESDGALWLKTSEYGDEKDRVLVRSDGKVTYFLGDIAYHNDKFSRDLDLVCNVWGADHQGHVKRMFAVKKMLGWEGDFHIFVAQLVMLKDAEGDRAKMSKRAGNVVLLEDLIKAVGVDVARWFFLERALSTQMDFDLELAKERSEKNPVRYVQYAHARMCSILTKVQPLTKVEPLQDVSGVLEKPSARALALKILAFPEVIDEIAKNYAVNQLATYTYELAEYFSAFYRDVRVIEKDERVNEEALAMVVLTKNVIAKCLHILGISAPEKM